MKKPTIQQGEMVMCRLLCDKALKTFCDHTKQDKRVTKSKFIFFLTFDFQAPKGKSRIIMILNKGKNLTYHFHQKNNFDNEDDYFVHEHLFLQMMMIMEYYKQNIENIRYDNINQGIQ
jgi:hypothetical protein